MSLTNNGGYAIQAFSLTKHFWQRSGFLKKRKITAVDNLNLEVSRGEIFGILGQNGAGKTTLIKMLCSLVLPDEGSALIDGYNLIKDENKIKSSIGLITSNERSFYQRLTGRQNLEFFGTLQNIPPKILKQRIDEILYLVGLEKAANIWFQNYSAGMKQRLAICRGLLHNPDILFMDEPTSGLDPLAANKLCDFIKTQLSQSQGKTVIIATHQTQEAEKICDRIAIMHKGKIKACGRTSEIVSHEKSIYNIFVKIVGENNEISAY